MLVIALLCFSLSMAQDDAQNLQTKQDTVDLISNLQKKAGEAIIRQELTTILPDLNRANELAQSIGDTKLQAAIFNDIAKFYFSVQDYEKARIEVAKAINLLKDDSEADDLAEAYVLEAQLLIKEGNFTKATGSLDAAFSIYESKQDDSAMARINLNKGMLALERRNPTSAVNYLDAALSTFQELNLEYFQAKT